MPPDPEWVAALAFLVNRLPSLAAQGFFQRLFDLRSMTATARPPPAAQCRSTRNLVRRISAVFARLD